MNNDAYQPSSKFKTIVCILFCAFILILSLSLISNQTDSYNTLRAHNDQLQQDLARQVAIYENLSYHMANFDSDAYIEALARERFGWVGDNEIVFRMVTD